MHTHNELMQSTVKVFASKYTMCYITALPCIYSINDSSTNILISKHYRIKAHSRWLRTSYPCIMSVLWNHRKHYQLFWGIYCSTVAWWNSSTTEYWAAFISCCSNGGSRKVLPGYSTVDVSNTSSEPEQSNDRATRDELPPDENRRRRLEANVVSASPDLWRTLSPPLADRRRVTLASVSPTSTDTWR